MKNIYNILALTLCFCASLVGQKDTESFKMNYNVANYDNIRIHNFKGDVTVNAKTGNQFELKVQRILKSKSNSKLNAAKTEVYVDTTVVDGEFIVFMVAPDKHFKMDENGNSYYNGQDWNNWSKNKIKDYGVEYEFIIDATIPPSKNLYAATHHKDVTVKGINGNTTVKSHHGSVRATTGGDIVIAKTHHGDVTVEHSSSNVTEGVYKTHHGDINTSFPQLSADATMKSHHGSFYIDFDYQHVAQQVKMREDGKKTKYKLGGDTAIRVGSGSGKLTYATHHGDTYIAKN